MNPAMSWGTLIAVWVGLVIAWVAAATALDWWRSRKRRCLDYLGTAWVCDDCLMAEAYPSEQPHPLAWSRIGDCVVTPGIITNEHLCMVDGAVQDGCDCDKITFSRCPCDGCGRREYGSRHAYTMWSK